VMMFNGGTSSHASSLLIMQRIYAAPLRIWLGISSRTLASASSLHLRSFHAWRGQRLYAHRQARIVRISGICGGQTWASYRRMARRRVA